VFVLGFGVRVLSASGDTNVGMARRITPTSVHVAIYEMSLLFLPNIILLTTHSLGLPSKPLFSELDNAIGKNGLYKYQNGRILQTLTVSVHETPTAAPPNTKAITL
jgi:hypothetical protein